MALVLDWRILQKERGNIPLTLYYKKQYQKQVIESLKRPHKQYEDKLKQFPMLSLH